MKKLKQYWIGTDPDFYGHYDIQISPPEKLVKNAYINVVEKSAYDKAVEALKKHNCAIIGKCRQCETLKELGEL